MKAASAYQNFLKLWKDADAELPILKRAKAEDRRAAEESPTLALKTFRPSRPSATELGTFHSDNQHSSGHSQGLSVRHPRGVRRRSRPAIECRADHELSGVIRMRNWIGPVGFDLGRRAVVPKSASRRPPLISSKPVSG